MIVSKCYGLLDNKTMQLSRYNGDVIVHVSREYLERLRTHDEVVVKLDIEIKEGIEQC